MSYVVSWEWKSIPGRANGVSKGSEMEKCKLCVVHNKEPKVTVTNYVPRAITETPEPSKTIIAKKQKVSVKEHKM